METVVGPPAEQNAELHLLTEWGGRDARRTRRAGLLSFLLHCLFIGGLALLPKSVLITPLRQQITPLVAPLLEPTQNTPNKGPVRKEVTAEALMPRPRIQIPPSPPSTTRPAATRLGIPAPPPKPAPASLPEPPKIEAPREIQGPRIQAELTAPPQIQAQEPPKLALENPPPPAAGPKPGGAIPLPDASVQSAIRSMAKGGTGGGLTVGDIGAEGPGGLGGGMNLPPSPGKQGSNLELLSDPMGVDFRPYLIRILSTVRRNWFAVMPESAKLGRRGRVGIQFAIDRAGAVPKLVIINGSGTDALDRAAVAGISASNPFPPLPPEFRGSQIRLQFNFMYNMR